MPKPECLVIGGGIYGALCAVQIAERGYPVTLVEKDEIALGATQVNQCRNHYGYHYPRALETVRAVKSQSKAFEEQFPDCIVQPFDSYYAVARENSKVSSEEYLEFCKDMGLPFSRDWPSHNLSRDTVDICLKVPETIFDPQKLQASLYRKIGRKNNIRLLTRTEVVDIHRQSEGFLVSFSGKHEQEQAYTAVVNATYSNINAIHELAGLPTNTYQYDLCEEPVIAGPWTRSEGFAIMDGPFFGLMPFGDTDGFVLYDVEQSVLERCTGTLPDFEHDISFYNEKKRRERRFAKYKEKVSDYLPSISRSSYKYSLYAVRIVPPNQENDARPTQILNPCAGFWSVMSGKVCSSITAATMIGEEVNAFLKEH